MALVSTTIRLDPELMAATRAEADRLGLSWSEYVRQALCARVAWSLALEATAKGADPAELAKFGTGEFEAIAEITRRISDRE